MKGFKALDDGSANIPVEVTKSLDFPTGTALKIAGTDITTTLPLGAITFTGKITQTDQAYAASTTGAYFISSSVATTGTQTAFRARAESEAAGAATGEVRGVYGQGIIKDSLYGGTATGVFGNAIAKTASTCVGLRGGFFEAESEGTPTEIANLYGTYTRVKTSVAPTTDFIGSRIETEKFGSGVALDSFLNFKTTTWTAGETVAAYVVDAGDLVGTVTSIFNLGAVTATNLFEVDADGDGAFTLGTGMVKDPESDQEAGFITILIGSTGYEIPFYAKA